MFTLATVVISGEHEPPRPALTPRKRVQAFQPTVGPNGAYLEDWGLVGVRPIRFASSPTQGIVTPAQVTSLFTLYEAGASFTLTTDLLAPLGSTPQAYTARFDPSAVPTFTPVDPGATYYYFDMLLLVN